MYIKSPAPLIIKVTANTIIAVTYFCEPKALPPKVEVKIEGIRAIVVIPKKAVISISVSPAK